MNMHVSDHGLHIGFLISQYCSTFYAEKKVVFYVLIRSTQCVYTQ